MRAFVIEVSRRWNTFGFGLNQGLSSPCYINCINNLYAFEANWKHQSFRVSPRPMTGKAACSAFE